MTVAELIAHLHTFPPEMLVVYSWRSEYSAMDAEEVRVRKLRRCGSMEYMDLTGPESDSEIETVVAFPGN